MKVITVIFLVVSACLLQGCSYPYPAKVEQKDSRPAIGITGAPEGALLFVDGLQMGSTGQYDGTNSVLLVESGKHLIEVKTTGGRVLLSETVFLSSSTTKILAVKP